MPDHAENKDYYALLDISPEQQRAWVLENKTPEDINQIVKKAWREQVMKWHPDKNPGNEAIAKLRFQEIQEAYDMLRTPQGRDILQMAKEEKKSFSPTPSPRPKSKKVFDQENPYSFFFYATATITVPEDAQHYRTADQSFLSILNEFDLFCKTTCKNDAAKLKGFASQISNTPYGKCLTLTFPDARSAIEFINLLLDKKLIHDVHRNDRMQHPVEPEHQYRTPFDTFRKTPRLTRD